MVFSMEKKRTSLSENQFKKESQQNHSKEIFNIQMINKNIPDQQLMETFIPQKAPRKERPAWNGCVQLGWPI